MPNALAPELADILTQRDYPGRGIAIGRDGNGRPFALYWLTGRSLASRSRYLQVDSDAVAVRDATDGPADALRHYTAIRRAATTLIVGNGDHTDVLFDRVSQGIPFEVAMRDVSFEPDPPIRTPRIAAFASVSPDGGVSDICLSGALSVPAWPQDAQQRTVHAAALQPRQCLAITTYTGDADRPTPSGIAVTASASKPWPEIAANVWSAINPEYRVALVGFDIARGFDTAVVHARDSGMPQS